MNKHRIITVCLLFAVGALTGMVAHSYLTPYKTLQTSPTYYESSAFKIPMGFTTIMPKKPVSAVRVPILLYHYVEFVKDKRDTIRQQLDITPVVFERQMATLQDGGYTFLFMNDLADILDGTRRMPAKPVILTFDDGYGDFYTDVLPILKKYRIKATAYIVSGFLGHPNYMSRDEVKELAQSGLVEIASHTIHHMNLKNTPASLLIKEISDSKMQLGVLIGRAVQDFAYPYGGFSNVAESAVRQAGYRTAVSVIPGDNQSETNRYYLSRLRPGSRSGTSLLTWLEHESL